MTIYPNSSEEWKVAHYNRNTAQLVSRTSNGDPRYGGTINDNSVLRYLAILKERSLKIMFYPLIMIDNDDKAWRGHIT